MINKFFFIGFLILTISSCSTPSFLPSVEYIDVDQNGSYIKINNKTPEYLGGELIAVDSNSIVVMSEKKKRCITIEKSKVKKYSLRYAKTKNYGWTIPVFALSSISHGFYAIVTLPLNLIATIAITASSSKASSYTDKTISYDQLRMFARFPQGIPPNISLESIKPVKIKDGSKRK